MASSVRVPLVYKDVTVFGLVPTDAPESPSGVVLPVTLQRALFAT